MRGTTAFDNGGHELKAARRWSVQCLLLAFGHVANGHAAVAGEDDIFFAELPLIASVSRLPQRISETPASVTVIDQEMIRTSGARTVEDLLRLVPGFQVTSHNQDPAIVTYHGLSTGLSSGSSSDEFSSRVQVLIDGRSQFSPLFKSGVNWNLLPVILENIERIEVTRGSNTVSYGSNAVMGVINIITQEPAQTRGWMVAANHGNNQVSDQTLRWSGGTEDLDLRFSAKQFQDGGFTQAYYSTWSPAPDTRRTGLLDLRADLRLGNRDEIQFTASQVEDVSEYGRPDRLTDPLREMTSRSRALGIQWRRVVSSDEEYALRYNFTQDWASAPYLRQYTFDVYPSGTNVTTSMPFDSGGESRVHELEFEHRLAPFANTRLTWGSAVKSIELRSPAQFTDNDWKKRNNARVFGNLEYKPHAQWLFNFGASLEKDSINGTFLDPRASLSYHLTPEHTLRLVAARAHRTPSLYEAQGYTERWATYNGVAKRDITYRAPGVDPERIDSFEIGYLGELKEYRLSLDVRLFSERIPNHIQIVPLALPANSPDEQGVDLSRYSPLSNTPFPYGRADGAINLEDVRIHGYEQQWRWQPFEGTRLIYNHAMIAIDAELSERTPVADDTINTDKISRQTRASAPLHSQSAMLIQKLPFDLQASVMYYRSDTMRWRRNGGPVQASERFDWRLAKSFRFGSTRGEIAYTAQMVNAAQEGRVATDTQPARLADKLQWLSLRLDF